MKYIQNWGEHYPKHHLTCNSRGSMRPWMFKQRFFYIEFMKFNMSRWKVYHKHKYKNAACYTSLTWNWCTLMYEFRQVKWMPATEWICIIELEKWNNANDGCGNVNNQGTFTWLIGILHTKYHVNLILIASNECQRYITPTKPRWSYRSMC